MTNIIGPIDRETFYTMGMLRENIREMTRLNKTKGTTDYAVAIEGQKELIRDFFKSLKPAANDNIQQEALAA